MTPVQSTETQSEQGIGFSMIFTISSGLSLYWASFFSMWMYNSFIDGGIIRTLDQGLIRIVFLASFCVAGILIAVLKKRAETPAGQRLMFAGGCLFPLMAAVFSVHSLNVVIPPFAEIVSWGLTGLGLACILYLWASLLSSLGKTAVIRCLAVSILLGSAVYWVINSLPLPLNFILLCAASAASLAMVKILGSYGILKYPQSNTRRTDAARRNPRMYYHVGVLFVYGIVFGLGLGSISGFQGGFLLYGGIALFLALEVGITYAFFKHLPGNALRNRALRTIFPMLVIALIPASFVQGIFYTICNLLLLSSFICLEIIDLDAELSASDDQHSEVFSLVAVSQIPLFFGLAIGYGICVFTLQSGATSNSTLSAVALGLVFVLGILACFAPFKAEAPSQEQAVEHDEVPGTPGKWKAKCLSVAEEHGLSARETEVFILLAKGRSVEYIQNKLFISRSTVKTHTYNIYKKLGINSREEMFELIEPEE